MANEAPEPTNLTARPATAYHRRQGPGMSNREHAVLDQDLIAGRFKRAQGDALCRPARTFWGLEPTKWSPVDCPKCIALATRHGVTLIDPTQPKP